MKTRIAQAAYFEVFFNRNWLTWLWAGITALGLNIVLFALMPYLQHPDQARPAFDQPLTQINIVRIKRPESPVKRETEKPPEPPRPQKRPKPLPDQPAQAKLTLPFALNPRLPAGAGALALPDLAPATLDTLGLGDAFSVGDLDAPLTVLARVAPVYPLSAKHRGIEGWVRVRFMVIEDGSVAHAQVMESKPPGIFDKNVIQCVSGWRFKPGTIEGMAVKAWVETTIRFELQ